MTVFESEFVVLYMTIVFYESRTEREVTLTTQLKHQQKTGDGELSDVYSFKLHLVASCRLI